MEPSATPEIFRSPGEKWPITAVEEMGRRIERGWKGLMLKAHGGPLSGDRLSIPHIDWPLWVLADGDLLRLRAHPPGYLLQLDAIVGTPLGFYAFDRASESVTWTDLKRRAR